MESEYETTTTTTTTTDADNPNHHHQSLKFITASVRAVSKGGSCFATIMQGPDAGDEIFIHAGLGNAFELQVGEEVSCAVVNNSRDSTCKFYAKMVKPLIFDDD